MFAVDVNLAFFGGQKGMLYKYYNGNWSQIMLPSNYYKYDIQTMYFIDENTGWIVIGGSIIYLKNGLVETDYQMNMTLNYETKIHFFNNSNGWLTAGDNLHHLKNNLWEVDTNASKMAFVQDIHMFEPNSGIIVGSEPYNLNGNIILGRYDFGTWSVASTLNLGNNFNTNTIEAMDLTSSGNGLVVGYSGLVLKISSISTGVDSENESKRLAVISPNPVNDVLNIISNDLELPNYQIQIINNLGQLCLTASIDKNTKGIDISNLPKGIYTVKTGNDNKLLKFVKE